MADPFYDVLGLDADADAEAVGRAYREAVKEHHPDVVEDPGATQAFRRLTVARDVLRDERERARYDHLGHEAYVRRHGHGGPWADTVNPARGQGPTSRARAVAGGSDRDRVTDDSSASERDVVSGPDGGVSADSSGPANESTVGGAGAAYYSVGERLRPSRRAPTRLHPLGTLRRIGVWAAVDAFLVGVGVATAWLLVSWGEGSAVSYVGAVLLLTVVSTTAAVHLATQAAR